MRGSASKPVAYTERAIAGVLLAVLSPIMGTLAVLVRATMGKPVLYRGERLGRDRAPFTMYKFRTLPADIEQRLGEWLFSERQEVLPPVARFLRDTRLDELPQLINVARGEMQFLGPRPERREVYQRVLREVGTNPDYHLRFVVAPGLLGVSQVITPHSAPKELRARLDRRYSAVGHRLGGGFVLWALSILVSRFFSCSARYFWHNLIRLCLLHRAREKRAQSRERPPNVWVEYLDAETDQVLLCGEVLNMNRDFIRARFDRDLSWPHTLTYRGRISVFIGIGEKRRYKTARCLVEHCDHLVSGESGHDYLLGYEPVSELARYRIDQYLLQQSIIKRR